MKDYHTLYGNYRGKSGENPALSRNGNDQSGKAKLIQEKRKRFSTYSPKLAEYVENGTILLNQK